MASQAEAAVDRRQMPAEGALSGLFAGVVFALAETVTAVAAGLGGWAPWRMAASLLLGPGALVGSMYAGLFVVGLVVHLALAAFFGSIWGAVAEGLAPARRDSWATHGAAAAAYGVLVYLLNFQVIGRLFYPHFVGVSPLAQILLHALAYGLPLGLALTAQVRPVERRMLRAPAAA